MTHHHSLRVLFTSLLVIIFIAASLFNVLFETGGTGVFINRRQAVYETFPTDALPIFWSVYLGAAILAWQAVWVSYSISLLCRVGPGGPEYLDPTLLSSLFLGLYSLGHLLYLGWSFSLDRNIVPLAFVLGLAATIVFIAALSCSHLALYNVRCELARQNRRFDDILVRVLVQNGISALVFWTLSRTIQTMSILIAYWSTPIINQETSVIIALSIQLSISLMFIVLDITVIDKFTRYNYLVYVSSIVMNSAIIVKSSTYVPVILASVMIGAAVCSIVVKIILGVQRNKTNPVFPTNVSIKEEIVN